jgi:hypothetical protein
MLLHGRNFMALRDRDVTVPDFFSESTQGASPKLMTTVKVLTTKPG